FYVYQFNQGSGPNAGGFGDGDMWVSLSPHDYGCEAMFVSPAPFVYHYVHVIAPKAATVKLDCQIQTGPCTSIGLVDGVDYCGWIIKVDASSTPMPADGPHVLAVENAQGSCRFGA